MFKPRCLPILIGSLPLKNHEIATQLILDHTPQIPLWPQLPKNPGEGMVRQFLTGFPGLQEDGNRFWIDSDSPGFPEEMTAFYEDYMQAESDVDFLKTSRFKLDNSTAAGFSTLLGILKNRSRETLTIKGQITGPITTGIGTRDQNEKSIIYDDNLRDMLVKHLSQKARWQVLELYTETGDTPPILFIDEPGLVSFGSSAFTGISREMVVECVGDVIRSIQNAGGLAGIHICANGDWGPALESGTDILSFDAYSFFDNFILFKEPLMKFLERGGILAWGIIPTGDPLIVAKETSDNLYSKWLEQLAILESFGLTKNQIMEQTLIAPACGTGSLTPELASKVLTMNLEVSGKCQYLLNHSPTYT